MTRIFRDRTDAGRQLAERLAHLEGRSDLLVLALPRGGVPVAREVARALKAGLDVMVVRKLGVPGHEELAMGAIASGGARILNEEVINAYRISPDALGRVEARERRELERRETAYRGGRAPLRVEGRTVVLVDDGLATGASMIAAVRAIQSLRPERVVVAVPVAPPDTARRMQRLVDEFVCVSSPAGFMAIGQFYQDFSQLSDAEVGELLADFRKNSRGK